jgi:Flp pilus assembly protein TadD
MHLHSPDYQEKAVAEFEEVLKLQPDNVSALRGLGYAYLMKRDFRRAGEYFTRATEHDSNDPRVLYYSALLAQRDGELASGDSARLSSIQKSLEKSVALDPDFADAYSVLAFTYMSQGNNEQALKAINKAVALNPRNEQYRFNLAQMYLANRKVNSALAVLEQLKNSSDPGVAARASQSLAQAHELKQAMRTGEASVSPSSQPPADQEVVASGHPAIIDPEPAAPKELPPVRFLKGKITAVDCSSPPGAVLTVLSGTKTWKLQVRDSGHVVVVGADSFSCAWKNQGVAVNYRATGEANGEVVSVEVQ